jgi:NAD(P)-dependent dehydrogenase (short-subunit alcohol dehydrogenase family)
MSDDSLAGRRVLVFGAAGALGAGVAEAFRAAGAEVTGVDRAEPPDTPRRDGVLSLNLVSAALVTKHALRVMQPVGEGRIVHTASRAGVVSKGSGFAYSVSKLGVLHLVTMAAEETRGTGVTVNCIVPSIIDTPANRAAMPDARHEAWPKIPDIARSYLFLASPGAALVSGAAVPV